MNGFTRTVAVLAALLPALLWSGTSRAEPAASEPTAAPDTVDDSQVEANLEPDPEPEPEADPDPEPDAEPKAAVVLPNPPEPPLPDTRERSPWLGGFGFFAPGFIVGNFGDMKSALQADTALGKGGAPPPFAFNIGGGGGYLLAGTYVIRGKGFYFFAPSSPTTRGRSTHVGGGGGFDIGMVVFNRRSWLLYPYFGVGGVGTTMTVKNEHTADIDLAGRTITPGETAKFSSGYFTFELGFAFQRLMFRKPTPPARVNGGLVNGGEIGLLASFNRSQWQESDTTIRNMPSARMLGLYVRLLMGGGGFSRWQPPKFGKRRGKKGQPP